MQLFRRHIFRKLARVLVVAVLFGNTALVWASVDSLLTKQGAASTCHMQMMEDHQAKGDCCSDNSDCMNYCNSCPMTATTSVVFTVTHFNFHFQKTADFLSLTANFPDGISAGHLYRPPILSA